MNIFFYHDYIYNQYFILEIKTDLSYDQLISFLKFKTKQNLSIMGVFTLINNRKNKYFFGKNIYLFEIPFKQNIFYKNKEP